MCREELTLEVKFTGSQVRARLQWAALETDAPSNVSSGPHTERYWVKRPHKSRGSLPRCPVTLPLFKEATTLRFQPLPAKVDKCVVSPLRVSLSFNTRQFGREDPMSLASWRHLNTHPPTVTPQPECPDLFSVAAGKNLDLLQIPSGAGQSLRSHLFTLNSKLMIPEILNKVNRGSEPWVMN